MIMRAAFQGPSRLLLLFFLAAGVPFGALGWLGWRFLEQDRSVERQRLRDRLEGALNVAAHESPGPQNFTTGPPTRSLLKRTAI